MEKFMVAWNRLKQYHKDEMSDAQKRMEEDCDRSEYDVGYYSHQNSLNKMKEMEKSLDIYDEK